MYIHENNILTIMTQFSNEEMIQFLVNNLNSKERIDLGHERFELGKFCQSHLDLLKEGNKFTKEIAMYRVDMAMRGSNLGNMKTQQSDQQYKLASQFPYTSDHNKHTPPQKHDHDS